MTRYPYGHLPHVEESSLPWIRRLARSGFTPGPVSKVVTELAGCPTTIDPPSFRAFEHRELAIEFAGARACVALVGTSYETRAVIELSPPLASSLVDRVLGGDGTAPAAALTDGQRGVLAFLAAETLKRLGSSFRVATVLTTSESIVAFLGHAGAGVWSMKGLLGERAGVFRAWVPAMSRLELEPSRPRNVPVVFVRDMASAMISGETLRGLHLDDVLLFDAAERFGEGMTRVRAMRGARSVWWLKDGVVNRREERESAPSAQGTYMDKPVDTEATQVGQIGQQPGTVTANANYEEQTRQIADGLSAVGDAPLEVALEIARFTLPLDEVSRLAPGEVLGAGASVGDEVRLRAGDRLLAVGELVDIDGQVGIRIRRLP